MGLGTLPHSSLLSLVLKQAALVPVSASEMMPFTQIFLASPINPWLTAALWALQDFFYLSGKAQENIIL